MGYEILLLIAIIILLAFSLFYDKMKSTSAEGISVSRSNDGKLKTAGAAEHAVGCRCAKCFNPEKEALAERTDYYALRGPMCMVDCDKSDMSFAKFEYGSPNADFKDYIAADAVSSQVVKQHQEYVKDRLSQFQTQNITGRTFTVDTEIEGDTPVPWQGIRGRPQHVPQYNPTQMPDVDAHRYAYKQKLVWDSS